MKLRDFIVTEAIVPELQASDREGVIRELVKSLVDAGAVAAEGADELVASLIKREQGGSTGLGKGVAVPHVKHARVGKLVATIGRSVSGVDFNSIDRQPVFSVVMVLSPDAEPQQRYLQVMSTIFSNLQQDIFRRFLRQSETRQAIVELLDEADQGK
jgi:mannitol/fructose-specific phosphotransferase system IIA component (Ntr-type)